MGTHDWQIDSFEKSFINFTSQEREEEEFLSTVERKIRKRRAVKDDDLLRAIDEVRKALDPPDANDEVLYTDYEAGPLRHFRKKFLHILEAELQRRRPKASKSDVSVQSASGRGADKASPQPGAEKQHMVAARRVIVRRQRDLSDKDLCALLDREHIGLPKPWQTAGFKTWTEVWPTKKRYIHVIFSKDRNSS